MQGQTHTHTHTQAYRQADVSQSVLTDTCPLPNCRFMKSAGCGCQAVSKRVFFSEEPSLQLWCFTIFHWCPIIIQGEISPRRGREALFSIHRIHRICWGFTKVCQCTISDTMNCTYALQVIKKTSLIIPYTDSFPRFISTAIQFLIFFISMNTYAANWGFLFLALMRIYFKAICCIKSRLHSWFLFASITQLQQTKRAPHF